MNRPQARTERPLRPFLLLIRGLPGSGKSTLARKLQTEDQTLAWFEADNHFTLPDGSYSFQRDKLPEAHAQCLEQARTSLAAGKSTIVSNTFVRKRELDPYLNLGYPTAIIECRGNYKSTHGVPEETISRMRERFEPFYYEGEDKADEAQKIIASLPVLKNEAHITIPVRYWFIYHTGVENHDRR